MSGKCWGFFLTFFLCLSSKGFVSLKILLIRLFLRLSFFPSNEITGSYIPSFYIYCWSAGATLFWALAARIFSAVFHHFLHLLEICFIYLNQNDSPVVPVWLFTQVFLWFSAFGSIFSALTSSLQPLFTQAGSQWLFRPEKLEVLSFSFTVCTLMHVCVISSVQSLSCVRFFATPWIAARQASLSITISCDQSCPTLCNPMDCNPPGSSVHGISWAGISEWIFAFSFSRGSSQPRDWIPPWWLPLKEEQGCPFPVSELECFRPGLPPSSAGNKTLSIEKHVLLQVIPVWPTYSHFIHISHRQSM